MLRTTIAAGAALAVLAIASASTASAAGVRIVNPGTIRGLNPQPLPPKWLLFVNPGTIRGLNPQPLPPRFKGRRI